MEIDVYKVITKTIEIKIKKYAKIPARVLDYESCAKCRIEFDKAIYSGEYVIAAKADKTSDFWFFCEKCFAEEEKRMEE